MASIILAAAGTAIGGSIGGSILGVSAATIGGAVGSLAGAVIDSWLVASMAPTQKIAGQRLDTLQITSSTEGAVIPRVYGRIRVGGNIIWATDFREESETTRHGGGGKGGGGGGGTEVAEYLYFASLAVALCEGPITGVGRIWADSKPMNLEGVTMRVHLGDEDQEPDPFIAAKLGAANTPANRGTAYVVFEELPLERFGNRMPQLSFEVFRPILDGASAECLVRAVTLIPASGELPLTTWTKIAINNTEVNDQGAFDAANNRFVAPVAGTYLFGASLLDKVNASTTARMNSRLVLNGSTEIKGGKGEISATHVSLATTLTLQTMVLLAPGDTVELQGYFRAADGYFAADHTTFWGCKVG